LRVTTTDLACRGMQTIRIVGEPQRWRWPVAGLRQGADVGTQYRSAIFHHSPEQKQTAETLIAELDAQKTWDRPIVTEVTPLDTFYCAEDYHQGYFRANPEQGYCSYVIAPKVAKFRKHFTNKLRN